MSSTTPNPRDGDELSVTRESTQWEGVGRELLQAKLDQVNEELIRESFRNASVRIAEKKQLRQSDIQAMREALQRAERTVELTARVSPHSTPRPDPWEYLDEQSKQEYIDDVNRQQD